MRPIVAMLVGALVSCTGGEPAVEADADADTDADSDADADTDADSDTDADTDADSDTDADTDTDTDADTDSDTDIDVDPDMTGDTGVSTGETGHTGMVVDTAACAFDPTVVIYNDGEDEEVFDIVDPGFWSVSRGSSPPVPGVVGSALDVSAAGCITGTQDASELDRAWPGADNFSVDFWVRTPNPGGGVVFAMDDCGGACPVGMANPAVRVGLVDTSGDTSDPTSGVELYFSVRDLEGDEATVQLPVAFDDGQWHHVAAIRFATFLSIYVDGAFGVSSSFPDIGSIQDQDQLPEPIGIGCATDPGATTDTENLTGEIDELVLSHRALPNTEVAAIYANPGPRCVGP